MKSLEDFKSFKQQIGQHMKAAKSIRRTTDGVGAFYGVHSEQDIWVLWYQFFNESNSDKMMHELLLKVLINATVFLGITLDNSGLGALWSENSNQPFLYSPMRSECYQIAPNNIHRDTIRDYCLQTTGLYVGKPQREPDPELSYVQPCDQRENTKVTSSHKVFNITLEDSKISCEIGWVLLLWRVYKTLQTNVAVRKSFVRPNPSETVCWRKHAVIEGDRGVCYATSLYRSQDKMSNPTRTFYIVPFESAQHFTFFSL
ncbi:hypothetical protein BDF21DRAFT_403074 [Thamnidium elegans]|nr:hypothetical protein BDF21DRAFT_403074 [Thamnidium elegans]